MKEKRAITLDISSFSGLNGKEMPRGHKMSSADGSKWICKQMRSTPVGFAVTEAQLEHLAQEIMRAINPHQQRTMIADNFEINKVYILSEEIPLPPFTINSPEEYINCDPELAAFADPILIPPPNKSCLPPELDPETS